MDKAPITDIKRAAETIKTAILQGQYEAAKGVNRIQLAVYFGIGKYVSRNTRKGVWGTGALEAISRILRKELPGLRGYSATQLREMRLFYEAWQMLDANSSVATDEISTSANVELHQQDNQPFTNSSVTTDESSPKSLIEVNLVNSSVITDELQATDNQIDIYHVIQIPSLADFPVEDFFKVPFTHHTLIRAIDKPLEARYYYIHRTAEEHLTTKMLEKLIKDYAYGKRGTMPSNFSQTIAKADLARKAVMMFKDSYLLDFINVEQIGEREAIDVDERVVEQQIVQNVKQFIMTFGRDFTFVGNQYHLEVFGVEHFPDLLFFNRELNALVVVELKTGEFKTSYLGQLMGYLSILDAKVKKAHENPSIGIVLCKEANREYVEFVIRDYNKPMGVGTYRTTTDMPEELRKALPDIEELKKLL